MLKKKLILLLILALLPYTANASDPFTSVYADTKIGSHLLTSQEMKKIKSGCLSEFLKSENSTQEVTSCIKDRLGQSLKTRTEDLNLCTSDHRRCLEAFNFDKENDNLFGSLAVGSIGSAQSVKLNAVNYKINLGGKHSIPFQVYVSSEPSTAGVPASTISDSNAAKVLDNESGLAFRFPFLFVYRSEVDSDYCAFEEMSVGRCMVGGDFTAMSKKLTEQNGNSVQAAGYALRLGASLLFPITEASTNKGAGFIAISTKWVMSRTNISDSTQLFSPINDASGNPIPFQNTIRANETEIKLSIDSQLSIISTWIHPLDSNPYISDQFKVTIESKFK